MEILRESPTLVMLAKPLRLVRASLSHMDRIPARLVMLNRPSRLVRASLWEIVREAPTLVMLVRHRGW